VKLKTSINLFFILLLLLNFQIQTHAQNRAAVFPRLEPDPKAIEYYRLGRQAGGYTWQQLAEISLWASGDTAASNLGRITAAAESLKNSPELPASGRERAAFVLTFLHRNILRSYSIYQTRVDTVFTNGRFNCVSSAVLYMILCKSLGIEASGVITKDHAFVTVHIGAENIDVETTNAYGFEPGNRTEFHDQFGRLTGFAYVPAQNYRDRKTISQIELVSLILNNRVADHERQNRFAQAVPVAIDRAALIFGESLTYDAAADEAPSLFNNPKKDLMDRLFNYGTMLLRAGREEEGLLWAQAASSRYPDNLRWQEFIYTAVNNHIARLIRENKITDTRIFLENNKNNLSQENYNHLDSLLTDTEVFRSRTHPERSPGRVP